MRGILIRKCGRYEILPRLLRNLFKNSQLNIAYSRFREAKFWHRLSSYNLCIREIAWVDESHYDNRDLNELYGRSQKGTRAKYVHFFGRGKRYSVIGACQVSGLLTYQVIDS